MCSLLLVLLSDDRVLSELGLEGSELLSEFTLWLCVPILLWWRVDHNRQGHLERGLLSSPMLVLSYPLVGRVIVPTAVDNRFSMAGSSTRGHLLLDVPVHRHLTSKVLSLQS